MDAIKMKKCEWVDLNGFYNELLTARKAFTNKELYLSYVSHMQKFCGMINSVGFYGMKKHSLSFSSFSSKTCEKCSCYIVDLTFRHHTGVDPDSILDMFVEGGKLYGIYDSFDFIHLQIDDIKVLR